MKYARWLLAWTLFWIGDALSRLDRWDIAWLIALWMPVYQTTMRWSCDIQGESNFGPWRAPSSIEAEASGDS